MGRKSLDHHTLVLVMGVAGSGKTTLAKGMLSRVCATYLDNNFVVDAFFADTRTAPEYIQLRLQLYKVLYGSAEENLLVGNSVVLDAPHVRQMPSARWQQLLDGLVSRTGSALAIIRCFCSEKTLRQRLLSRDEERDMWRFPLTTLTSIRRSVSRITSTAPSATSLLSWVIQRGRIRIGQLSARRAGET